MRRIAAPVGYQAVSEFFRELLQEVRRQDFWREVVPLLSSQPSNDATILQTPEVASLNLGQAVHPVATADDGDPPHPSNSIAASIRQAEALPRLQLACARYLCDEYLFDNRLDLAIFTPAGELLQLPQSALDYLDAGETWCSSIETTKNPVTEFIRFLTGSHFNREQRFCMVRTDDWIIQAHVELPLDMEIFEKIYGGSLIVIKASEFAVHDALKPVWPLNNFALANRVLEDEAGRQGATASSEALFRRHLLDVLNQARENGGLDQLSKAICFQKVEERFGPSPNLTGRGKRRAWASVVKSDPAFEVLTRPGRRT